MSLTRAFQRPAARAFQSFSVLSRAAAPTIRPVSHYRYLSSSTSSSSSSSSSSSAAESVTSSASSFFSSILSVFKKKEAIQVETAPFAEFAELAPANTTFETAEKKLDAKEFAEEFTSENFNIVMQGLLEAGSYSNVADVFLLMLLKGVEPDYKSWALVVQSYKDNGNTEDLENLALQVATIRGMTAEQKEASLKYLSLPGTPADAEDFDKVHKAITSIDSEEIRKMQQHGFDELQRKLAAAK